MKTTLWPFALIAAVLLVPALITWSLTSREDNVAKPATAPSFGLGRSSYAGSESCVKCHEKASSTHVHTAHVLSSVPAEKKHIKGSFASGKNVVRLDGDLSAKMEERDGRFVQQAIVDGTPQTVEPFDIVIGSGRKGQSYLYWDGDSLFQLPISYFVPSESWINSPGFPRDQLNFDRPVAPECLQCHSTFFKKKDPRAINEYDRSRIMYGIDCERCHGPSAGHVKFHHEHPEEKQARNIVRIASLNRQQRLDVCAQCHSGVRESARAPFTFLPGDSIAQATLRDYKPQDVKQLDVHSNQYGLLAASKCFEASGTLICTTCHNPHETQRDALAHSQNCLTCHKTAASCRLSHKVPPSQLANCVDCHMPELRSRSLVIQGAEGGKEEPLKVRTHLIAVYPEQSAEILKFIRKPKQDTVSPGSASPDAPAP